MARKVVQGWQSRGKTQRGNKLHTIFTRYIKIAKTTSSNSAQGKARVDAVHVWAELTKSSQFKGRKHGMFSDVLSNERTEHSHAWQEHWRYLPCIPESSLVLMQLFISSRSSYPCFQVALVNVCG